MQRVARSLGASVCVTLLLTLQLCVAVADEKKVKRDLDAPYKPSTANTVAAPMRQPMRDLDLPFSPRVGQTDKATPPPTSAPGAGTAPTDQGVQQPVVDQPPRPPSGLLPAPDAMSEALAANAPGSAIKVSTALALSLDHSYTLGSGDKLRMTIFGEEDLSGEFVVDGSGYVRLPLIGEEMASGRTALELEGQIAAQGLRGPAKGFRVQRFALHADEFEAGQGMTPCGLVAKRGDNTAICRISLRFFSPPENPSLRERFNSD